MQTKEDSFIKKVISSIKDFEKYPEMAVKPFSKVLSYLIKLMLIFTFIVTAISVYKVSININNGIEYFKNEIPNIEFVNNKLKVDSKEKIVVNPNTILNLIIIDTNELAENEIQSYKEEANKYSTSAIILKDKVIINTGAGTIQYEYEKIANIYNLGNMTKQEMINYFTGTNLSMLYVGIFIISFIWLFIAYLISVLCDGLIFGIIGYVTALILRLQIKFVAMIKLAIHALTLPILLNLLYIIVQALFNFEIKYFDVMYIGVTYIYIITAILMIKSDLIRRGQELTKIIEEEKRVKAELQKQKEQEQEEEQRKREDKEKEDDNLQEKEEENKEVGAEPQGENA
ncbi:MAG: DUF1189 domain-containing protein [Clostridia bacterium]|nr:DUF1189 domain-containing protein [Clostridia bacterium]